MMDKLKETLIQDAHANVKVELQELTVNLLILALVVHKGFLANKESLLDKFLDKTVDVHVLNNIKETIARLLYLAYHSLVDKFAKMEV
jgi:hypothetical protein